LGVWGVFGVEWVKLGCEKKVVLLGAIFTKRESILAILSHF
jgi:hypothetical protein